MILLYYCILWFIIYVRFFPKPLRRKKSSETSVAGTFRTWPFGLICLVASFLFLAIARRHREEGRFGQLKKCRENGSNGKWNGMPKREIPKALNATKCIYCGIVCIITMMTTTKRTQPAKSLRFIDGFKTYVFTGWIAPTLHGFDRCILSCILDCLTKYMEKRHLATRWAGYAWKLEHSWKNFWKFPRLEMKGNYPHFVLKLYTKRGATSSKFGWVGRSGASWRREIWLFQSTDLFWSVALGIPGRLKMIEGIKIKSVVLFFYKWTSSGLGFVDVLVVVAVVSNLTGLRLGMVDLPALNNHLAQARWASEARKTVGVSQTLRQANKPRKLLTGYGFLGLNWRNEMLVETRHPGHIARHTWLLQGEGRL